MTTVQTKIIDFIKQQGQVSSAEIALFLGITRQALYKHLPKLLAAQAITKIGKPPRVYYSLANSPAAASVLTLSREEKNKIEEAFFVITPAGERKQGVAAFQYWCDKNKLPYQKTADEYMQALAKYDQYKKGGVVSGLAKLQKTFSKTYLDELLYLDFYSIERFGKTKLGQLLLYAKQSQNLDLMREVIAIAKPKIDAIIQKYHIDAIGFIPPTVKRERQFMKVLASGLGTAARTVSIEKAQTYVAVPQKTLSKLEDRMENAAQTIIVTENARFANILLIDDAVGSGATLNETARKIREKGICSGKIIGLSLTGSFKGFDVISEV